MVKTQTEETFDARLADFRQRVDTLVHDRRMTGRTTYGQGLEHMDARYDWRMMALEEILDFAQYQQAEILRLQQKVDELELRLEGGISN